MLQRFGISAFAVILPELTLSLILSLILLQGAALAEIRIGVAGPESGQFRVLGEQMRTGGHQSVDLGVVCRASSTPCECGPNVLKQP